MTPFDLLVDPEAPERQTAARIAGVVIGIVTNNQDDKHLGRVKVAFPWLGAGVESDWARVATPMAGAGRGFYCLPEVNDEVLVAFEHGDPHRPYVVGALWNGKDSPPVQQEEGNHVRVLKSRSGHVVRLNDKEGEETIEIVDKSGDTLTFDAANKKITISAKTGGITLSAPDGTITLEAKQVEIKSSAGMTVEAAGALTIKGATVDIN